MGEGAQAELFAVHDCRVTGDVAVVLETLHAPPAGGGRQAHRIGERLRAGAPVALQFFQDQLSRMDQARISPIF